MPIKVTAIVLCVVLGLTAACGSSSEYEKVRNMEIEDVDLSEVPDGKYYGAFTYMQVTNSVQVTVKQSKIENIEIIQGAITRHGLKGHAVIDEVMLKQTPRVDVVSGATTTSKAFMKAVENALIQQTPAP